MVQDDSFRKRLGGLKRELQQAARRARAKAASRDRDGANVNIAGRANVVVAKNVGQPGSTNATAARQAVRIRQAGGETVEQDTLNETTT